MEETDDPTDIPEKLNPKYSSASPGLKGNPAVTGKIFSDDCRYIQRVTNPDTVREIEIRTNKLVNRALKKDRDFKDIIKSQQCPMVIEGRNVVVEVKIDLEAEDCIDKLTFDTIETYYIKNEILKRWSEILKTTTPKPRKECDTSHNTNARLRYKQDVDYFYYYEYTLPNGKVVYFSIAHKMSDDTYRLYTISDKMNGSE